MQPVKNQRNVSVSRVPLTKFAHQPPMRKKLGTTRECPNAVSTDDPPRDAKLEHLAGCILRMYGIGHFVDDSISLNMEGTSFSPDDVESIEVT